MFNVLPEIVGMIKECVNYTFIIYFHCHFPTKPNNELRLFCIKYQYIFYSHIIVGKYTLEKI